MYDRSLSHVILEQGMLPGTQALMWNKGKYTKPVDHHMKYYIIGYV